MIPQYSINRIHQVEITSRCNLRCRYCAHPTMTRVKEDMSFAVYSRVLDLIEVFVRNGTQHEISLHGIGESTMHPNFVEWLALARERMGPHVRLTLATNGVLLTDELCAAIAPYKPMVWVSLHRPEKAGPAIEAAKKHGILCGASVDPALAAIDWAGQVKWHNSADPMECMWVKGGALVALPNGDLNTCGLDGTDSGKVGTVWDDITTLHTKPHNLCRTCHMDLAIAGYEQKGACA